MKIENVKFMKVCRGVHRTPALMKYYVRRNVF
nr:MAG TPA: hypothetical protein [Caudoviricetes sp.]